MREVFVGSSINTIHDVYKRLQVNQRHSRKNLQALDDQACLLHSIALTVSLKSITSGYSQSRRINCMGFLNKATTAFNSAPEINLESFEDELAYKVEWTPLVRGGTSFTTHRLFKSPGTRRDTIKIKTTTWCYLFCSLWVILSAYIIAGTLSGDATWTVNGAEGPPPPIWPLLALLPAAVSCGMLYWRKKKEGLFEYQTYTFTRGKQSFDLEQVRAIQLIDERVSKGHRFRSYELNLVFNNCSRINILDHGSLGAIRQDSWMLSEFLRVPIWDAIGFRMSPTTREGDPKADIFNENLRA